MRDCDTTGGGYPPHLLALSLGVREGGGVVRACIGDGGLMWPVGGGVGGTWPSRLCMRGGCGGGWVTAPSRVRMRGGGGDRPCRSCPSVRPPSPVVCLNERDWAWHHLRLE